MSRIKAKEKRDELGYKTQVASPQCSATTHVGMNRDGKMFPMRCRKKAVTFAGLCRSCT